MLRETRIISQKNAEINPLIDLQTKIIQKCIQS